MRAAIYEQFGRPLTVVDVPDPTPPDGGVVIRVRATGICRTDWHGWMGHDPMIDSLPHVPGHELSGEIAAVGTGVRRWREGIRVTMPFVAGCGACPECATGNQQVCPDQHQPGFTDWGSFAEYVAVHYADGNLVRVPDEMAHTTAASLGCRFATSFRAIAAQGRVAPGEWVAVHGCGGVGLSAVMIAAALGASVVGVDISDEKLAFARSIGALHTVNANEAADVPEAVREFTGGGAHVSMDALGHPTTCFNSISCLRRRGRHVQVGLTLAEQSTPAVPMDRIVAHELEILGSHGIQAHAYAPLLEMIRAGKLDPCRLIRKTVDLTESLDELQSMDTFRSIGITVIDRF